jgi:hypothetical protein
MKVLLPEASQPIEIDIVSNTPGRLRLKVDRERRLPEVMEQIVTALKTFADFDRVRSNISNGSLTIYYNPEKVDFTEVFSQLHSLGVILDDIPENISQTSVPTARLTDAIGLRPGEAIAGLDRKIKQTTEDSIDLRSLATTLFSLFAWRQISKVPGLRKISWFILAWYIFESLLKFNNRSERSPSPKQVQAESNEQLKANYQSRFLL